MLLSPMDLLLCVFAVSIFVFHTLNAYILRFKLDKMYEVSVYNVHHYVELCSRVH